MCGKEVRFYRMSSRIYTCTPSTCCRWLLPFLPSGFGWSGILKPGQVCARLGHNHPIQLKDKGSTGQHKKAEFSWIFCNKMTVIRTECSIMAWTIPVFFFFLNIVVAPFVIMLQLSSSCSTAEMIRKKENKSFSPTDKTCQEMTLKTWDDMTVSKTALKNVSKWKKSVLHLCRNQSTVGRGGLGAFFQTHTNEMSFIFENEREMFQTVVHPLSQMFGMSWE